MLIKSLMLKNIRSYENLELEFKPGSTLLSGDIGSGKTTILLSIEFALFGLIRGTTSGSTLLRNGKREGEVLLSFELDGKNIMIQRALKRNSNAVSQDAGYIEINGLRTNGTAIELKAKILELLGYPDELLSKSKSMIFRYTVYTPQEEMKQILFDSADERVEKIRRIFDIDKYKRIKDNALNYAKQLRSDIKAKQTIIEDLESLKREKEKISLEIESRKKNLDLSIKKLEELSAQEEIQKEMFESLQEQSKLLKEKKHELQILEQQKRSQEMINNAMADRINELENDTKKEPSSLEIKIIATADFDKKISLEKEKLKELEQKEIAIRNKIAIIKNKIEEAKKVSNEILHLEKCPTCKQEVSEKHKEEIKKEQQKNIDENKEKLEKANYMLKTAEKIRESSIKIIEDLTEEKTKIQLDNQKYDQLRKEILRFEENKKKLAEQKQKKNIQEKEIQETIKKILEKQKEILEIKIDEQQILNAKKAYEEASKISQQEKIRIAEIKQQISASIEFEERIIKQISSKEEIKKKIEKAKKTENWITNQFVNVVDRIEKNVMVTVHQEFNGRYQEWLNTLLEDEAITSTLDENFTPIITQNGYDTEISNLSGGEKTSVALAYRLALNKVINEFMSTIKTRDIIILDEPTDGFSSEQLDKVREVLDALNAKQTIIVSHEPKMESFVQHVIRIRKQEHNSGLI